MDAICQLSSDFLSNLESQLDKAEKSRVVSESKKERLRCAKKRAEDADAEVRKVGAR